MATHTINTIADLRSARDAINGNIGTNLATNGDFSDTTSTDSSVAPLAGWANVGTHNANNKFTISDNQCTIISDGTYTAIGKYTLLTVGKPYNITIGKMVTNGGSIKVGGSSNTSYIATNITTAGTWRFTATETDFLISRNSAGTNITFDDVTIRECVVDDDITFAADVTMDSGGGGTDEDWEQIGGDGYAYNGECDGGGYEITGLAITDNNDYKGLFGKTGSSFNGHDLAVSGTITTTGDYVGGIVGYLSGTITNCYSNVDVTGGDHVGGGVGYNYDGNISTCWATGDISGTNQVGGFVGSNLSLMSKCYAIGDVSGTVIDVGGFVGLNSGGDISNCYHSGGELSGGTSNAGGFVGSNESSGTITDCHANGVATPGSLIGGFCGNDDLSGTFTTCYWNTESLNIGTDEGASGTSGLTTTQFAVQANFTGFDFTADWYMDSNYGYPKLEVFAPPAITINTLNDLQVLANVVAAGSVDTDGTGAANIDMSSIADWDGIGTQTNPYEGDFDGKFYTYNNMTLTANDHGGFFGSVHQNGTVTSVKIANATVTVDTSYAGALVGYNDGTITLCQCNDCDVTGDDYVGGFVGRNNNNGTINDCYVDGGPVEATTDYVGGFVGVNAGAITDSHAAAGTITNVATNNGGFAGDDSGTITTCYYNSTTTGQSDTGKGVPLTELEYSMATNFVGFDYVNTWTTGIKRPVLQSDPATKNLGSLVLNGNSHALSRNGVPTLNTEITINGFWRY